MRVLVLLSTLFVFCLGACENRSDTNRSAGYGSSGTSTTQPGANPSQVAPEDDPNYKYRPGARH